MNLPFIAIKKSRDYRGVTASGLFGSGMEAALKEQREKNEKK